MYVRHPGLELQYDMLIFIEIFRKFSQNKTK